METIESNNAFVSDTSTGDNYSKGWKLIFTTFIELLVVTLVYTIIQIPTNGIRIKPDEFEWFMVPIVMLAIGYGIFISGPIGYSVNWVFLKAVRREKIEIKDMFAVFERNYWNAVVAGLVTTIIIIIGLIMLIVPGIIFACRLAFVPYLVLDEKMEAMEALKTSWAMTKGYGWTVFFMGLLAFLIVIAGLIMLIFGVLISIMWLSAAFAILYHSVYLKQGIPVTNGAITKQD
jgi:uncharacterized membrane protein